MLNCFHCGEMLTAFQARNDITCRECKEKGICKSDITKICKCFD